MIRYKYVRGLSLFAVLMSVAGVSSAGESLKALLACREIPDAAARLACFDRESAPLAQAPAARATQAPSAVAPTTQAPVAREPAAPALAAPAPVAQAQSPDVSGLDPQQKFGLSEGAISAREVAAGARAQDLARIDAHITGLSGSTDVLLAFTLDNGQVWKQIKHESEMLAKVGDTVTISRQMFGSYWLQLKSGRGCKVTRVR